MIINGWETMNPDETLEGSLRKFLNALVSYFPDDFYGPTLDASLTITVDLPSFKPSSSEWDTYLKDAIREIGLQHGFTLIDIHFKDERIVLELR